MTATLFGTVCDELGLAKLTTVEGPRGDVRCRAWATSSLEVRSVQNPTIPLNIDHDDQAVVGEIVHLERSPHPPRRLWVVAHADVPILDEHGPPWYFSAETLRDDGGILVTGVGLTEWPLQKTNVPVRFLPGRVDYRGCTRRWDGLSSFQRDMLERAAQTFYDRRGHRGQPLVVHDTLVEPGSLTAYERDRPPAGPLEYRSAEQVGVKGREIELIVMPYDEPAIVEHQGRIVTEVVSRGAFAGIDGRRNRVRVNRDHDVTRTIGKAVRFDTHDPRGLVADLRIARTPLGDETLALADEGILDASAGFQVMPGGESWESRDRRRLSKLWLAHIALTPDPAYTGANVLAVRRAH